MFRIDQASRDLNELLDPEHWMSSAWGGDTLRDCRGCVDCRPDEDDRGETRWQCYGERLVEDVRHGISVCRDVDELVTYFATVGGDLSDVVLVELEGEYSDDEGHDAHLGEWLILPSRIVSATPLSDEIRERIHALTDQMGT
ncbi:hypothetical protein AB0M72_06850 [Nocardiopsis dassonvillei]